MKTYIPQKLIAFLFLLFIGTTINAQNNGCAVNGYYSFGPQVNGASLADGFTFDCTQPLQVEWCYTVEGYTPGPNDIWIHGIYPNPDPNWLLTGTFFNTNSTGNQWIFENPQGATNSGGFFFDDDGNLFSADGFGDPDSPVPGTTWEACFIYDYIGGCPNTYPVVDVFSLIMNVSGDNLTGAYFAVDPTECPPCPPPDDPFTFCPGSVGSGFTIQFAAPGLFADAFNNPCSCDNPNNIDLDANGIPDLFYEEITIFTNPPTPGIFDWFPNFSGTVLDAAGNPTTPFVNDNGDGSYTSSFYTPAVGTYNGDFQSLNFQIFTNQVGGGGCGPCEVDLVSILPCDCLNPNNVDLDGNGAFDIFYEEITFSTNPATSGIADWDFGPSTLGGIILDSNGNPAATPTNIVDNGDGTYTFGFYLLPNTTYQVDFISINAALGTLNTITGGNCELCLDIDIFGNPCQCSSPFNIDIDGDNLAEFIFQEVTVGINPPTPGIFDWTVGFGAGFAVYDQNGNPIFPGDPVFFIDNGDGTYTFQFWTESQFPYEVYFESFGFFGGFQTELISGFSCGPCPIVDPCACDNPLNIDLNGDGVFDLFHEEITYETNPPQTGINDWVFASNTIGPFYDAMGNITTTPVTSTDNGDGSYSFVVYLASGQSYQADFSSASTGIVTGVVAGGNCTPCGDTTNIPTLSEWGLILLALLLMSYGAVQMTAGKLATSGSSNIPIPMGNFNLPFDAAIFQKSIKLTATLAFIGFIICFAIYGAIFLPDIIGVFTSGPVFAYLMHLLYLSEKELKK